MSKIQLKNYDEHTGNVIGEVYPITNAEYVTLRSGQNLQEFLDNSEFGSEDNRTYNASDIVFSDGDTLQNKFDDGFRGADGFTWRPIVDSEGNLSWQLNPDMGPPPTINIKGPKGDRGEPGAGNSSDIIISQAQPEGQCFNRVWIQIL